MRTLFLRIFVGYLLVTLVIVVISRYLIFPTEFAISENRNTELISSLAAQHGAEAADAFEKGGGEGLRAFNSRVLRPLRTRATILDEQLGLLAGPPLPTSAQETARLTMQGNREMTRQDMHTLSTAVLESTANGKRLLVVLWMPRMGIGSPQIALHRLLIFLLISGLMCYALARYLAAPVKSVRAAIGRLAQGDLSARALPNPRGRHDELTELAQDFDRMAERIESLVTSQRRLLSDISHELRSPLARLRVALELAREKTAPVAEPMLARIELESERMNNLIEQLLTLARFESGTTPQLQESIPLDALLAEITADASFEVSNTSRTVSLQVATGCAVSGDRRLLRSAIENVVRNALRYTREGTAVEIGLHAESGAKGREAVITVRDHGEGVPEEALGKLFDVFYRVSEDRDRQSGGAGLGLAITARAIQLHGGTVQAHNAATGGLIVELRLPSSDSPV
jgi:signal transduction histidine kinase